MGNYARKRLLLELGLKKVFNTGHLSTSPLAKNTQLPPPCERDDVQPSINRLLTSAYEFKAVVDFSAYSFKFPDISAEYLGHPAFIVANLKEDDTWMVHHVIATDKHRQSGFIIDEVQDLDEKTISRDMVACMLVDWCKAQDGKPLPQVQSTISNDAYRVHKSTVCDIR